MLESVERRLSMIRNRFRVVSIRERERPTKDIGGITEPSRIIDETGDEFIQHIHPRAEIERGDKPPTIWFVDERSTGSEFRDVEPE